MVEFLEVCQGLLSAASGEEARLCNSSNNAALAPAEAFLGFPWVEWADKGQTDA